MVELSESASVENVAADRIVRLAANPAAGRPERLYLDVEDVWVGRRYE